ncbi:hypothetical protein SDC9_87973 [bioreactor metagenome]|uniref:Uncharacterized protein n=1 Tax=bioreactor metagenome TaxID=1076179 RepID=A0A644ZNC2_9ZZZZ
MDKVRGFEGGHGAVGGGGDHLAQGFGPGVARGKDAGNAGFTVLAGNDIAIVVDIQNALKEAVVGLQANGDKDSAQFDFLRGVRLEVMQLDKGHPVAAADFVHHAVVMDDDVLPGLDRLGQDVVAPEFVPAVD